MSILARKRWHALVNNIIQSWTHNHTDLQTKLHERYLTKLHDHWSSLPQRQHCYSILYLTVSRNMEQNLTIFKEKTPSFVFCLQDISKQLYIHCSYSGNRLLWNWQDINQNKHLLTIILSTWKPDNKIVQQ